MKRLVLLFALAAIVFGSCARGISPYEAAQGNMKCGRYIR